MKKTAVTEAYRGRQTFSDQPIASERYYFYYYNRGLCTVAITMAGSTLLSFCFLFFASLLFARPLFDHQ